MIYDNIISSNKKTIPELNSQINNNLDINLNNFNNNLQIKEKLAKKTELKEKYYFYSIISSLLITGNLIYLFIIKKSNQKSPNNNQYHINNDIFYCLNISALIFLLSIKGKSSIYDRLITPKLENNTDKNTPPTQKKRAILWTMTAQLKFNTILFEHFFRSTYNEKDWIKLQAGLWQISNQGILSSNINISRLHNQILNPDQKYPRKLIYINTISWMLFLLDSINLLFFEIDNYFNGYKQESTISQVIRRYNNQHKFNCLIRYTLGNIAKTLHFVSAILRYYPYLILGSFNHNIVASFNSSKNPNLLLLKSFLINLLPSIALAIYAFVSIHNSNKIQAQENIIKIRNTFAIINVIWLTQGIFWVLPILNPINPKHKNSLLKYLNINHLYKILFQKYLKSINHNIDSLTLGSFLISLNNLEGPEIHLDQEIAINNNNNNNNNNIKTYRDFIAKTNIRLLMPISLFSFVLGLIRNLSAIYLNYLFEYNKNSDRCNPVLSITKFISGLTLIPLIISLSICKNIIDIPNHIIMKSFNKIPNAPHKIIAFLISMISTIGLHHEFFEDKKISITNFLAAFTIATIQLMAIASVPINHATPKLHPTDIFKNIIIKQSNYEKVDEQNINNQINIQI